MLVRLKKYLDEMVEACVPRGAFCDLDNKIVTRCNNHTKNLLSAIEDLTAEIDQKLAARKTT